MGGTLAASVLRDAALLRVKRIGGELGVGGSELLSECCRRLSRREDIGEILAGE